MIQRRSGGRAKVAVGRRRAFSFVLVVNAMAAAQPGGQNEPSPAEAPRSEQPVSTGIIATPATPDEARPAEFPGMVQGGAVTAPRPAFARPWPTQRNVALLATEGSYSGFGLGLRAGWLRVGLDSSFAFFPILATHSVDPETFPEFKLLSSYQANASLWVGLHRLDARTDLGIAFGYKYNSLLQHGVSVAFYLQRELGAHWAIQGFIGPNIFPNAEDQIRQKTGWSQGSVLSGLAWHQAGVGLSLAFFP
jgi:hypothetical protein